MGKYHALKNLIDFSCSRAWRTIRALSMDTDGEIREAVKNRITKDKLAE